MASRLIREKIPKSDDPFAVVSALRVSYILQTIPGFVFLIFALMLPQSPYRLASWGHWREAHELMAALENGATVDPKILAHYEQMRAEIQAHRGGGRPRMWMLFHPLERSKLILGLFTQLWNQLCGIHFLLCLSAPKFKGSSSHGTRILTWPSQLDHNTWVMASAGIVWFPLAVFFIHLFNVLTAAMAGSKVADILGRRLTLTIGSMSMISCLMIMGEYCSDSSQPYQLTLLQEYCRSNMPSSTWGISTTLSLTTSSTSFETPAFPLPWWLLPRYL